MPPAVRLATPADLGALEAVLAETDGPFDARTELGRPYARVWAAPLADGAAAAPGELAGVILGWDVADEVHVIDLVVVARERRKGFGRALLAALVAHARARGARVVLLEVRDSNVPAIRLYESAGFEHVGDRAAYYADGEDARSMRLTLRE